LMPSRRRSSILLNSHACPWVLYSRNDTSLWIPPWASILMMNQWLLIPSTLTLRQSIVALPLLSSLLVLRPTLQMCILSSPINGLSICFWTTSPNVAHLPNSSWGDFTSDPCHWPLGTYRLYLPHG
jgi:hypothetical protein